MNRRRLLRGLAGAGAFAIAGCVADDGPAGDATDDQTDTMDDDTDTPDESTEAPTDPATDSSTNDPATDSPTDSDDTPTDDTDTPDDTDTTETGGSTGTPAHPEIVDEGLTVHSDGCGAQSSGGSIEFADEAVVLDGTTWGNQACYTAELDRATYDPGTDELTIAVAAVRTADDNQPCADCIAEIDYTARVTFDGDLPGSVTLVHVHGDDRDVVRTADR